jgi:hypothetical protein
MQNLHHQHLRLHVMHHGTSQELVATAGHSDLHGCTPVSGRPCHPRRNSDCSTSSVLNRDSLLGSVTTVRPNAKRAGSAPTTLPSLRNQPAAIPAEHLNTTTPTTLTIRSTPTTSYLHSTLATLSTQTTQSTHRRPTHQHHINVNTTHHGTQQNTSRMDQLRNPSG